MKAFHPRIFLGAAPLGSASRYRFLRPRGPVLSTPARLSSVGPRDLPRVLSARQVPARAFSVDASAENASPKFPPFAFAFDIDGVLLHVSKPIPGASETLQYLQRHNIPFILLTNGGGKAEAERVADLSARLGVALSTDNFVQSHTPFRELAQGSHHLHRHYGCRDRLRDRNVLVTGSDPARCRAIAHGYGFRHVVTPADVLAAHPGVFPYEPLLRHDDPKPLPCPDPRIDAIFVFNEPRDWAVDVQVILDLLMSRQGVLGTYSPKNGDTSLENDGWQQDGQPALFFSNPDLFWAAGYHHPRLGQGAFQAAMAGVWREVTGGRELQRTVFGKPHRQTYAYAERVLNAHRGNVLNNNNHNHNNHDSHNNSAKTQEEDETPQQPLERVYMIGDNPESDVRGANEFVSPLGTKWSSVLVRTGVYSEDRGPPTRTPQVVVDDVAKAVEWALRREGWR
ncbi:HAD-superfamily subfamily IIA hydrolase [Xylariaceae sp. FL0662B]|nr:HAD-superfamily subfamily IIA hydrolase [Xylariaceae sp. FL0662B]